MRLPRVRFTVRWLMVAVAVLALVLAGSLMARRSVLCHRWARYHAWEDWRLRMNGKAYLMQSETGAANRWHWYSDAVRYATLAAWHDRQALRYRRAAWRPWSAMPNEVEEPPWGQEDPPEPPTWTPSLPGLRETNSLDGIPAPKPSRY